MNERNTTDTAATMERRQANSKSIWGELVVELSWRPSDKPKVESEGWLHAHGYRPDRRQGR